MPNLIADEYKNFEDIKKLDTNGNEYWTARELATVLQYSQWRNFAKVIDRAKLACQNSGYDIDAHFEETKKAVEMPTKTKSNSSDFGFADVSKTKTKNIGSLSIVGVNPKKEELQSVALSHRLFFNYVVLIIKHV